MQEWVALKTVFWSLKIWQINATRNPSGFKLNSRITAVLDNNYKNISTKTRLIQVIDL